MHLSTKKVTKAFMSLLIKKKGFYQMEKKEKELKETNEQRTNKEKDQEKQENVQKKFNKKTNILIGFILLNVIVIICIIVAISQNTIENDIISDVKKYITEYTQESFDISDVNTITITNTKMEQLSDKKQFSVYGTFRIKDNYNRIYSASFKGTYDIVNKDGKEIYYSNQITDISHTIITYPNGIPINYKKYQIEQQKQVQDAIDSFVNNIDTGDLIGQ